MEPFPLDIFEGPFLLMALEICHLPFRIRIFIVANPTSEVDYDYLCSDASRKGRRIIEQSRRRMLLDVVIGIAMPISTHGSLSYFVLMAAMPLFFLLMLMLLDLDLLLCLSAVRLATYLEQPSMYSLSSYILLVASSSTVRWILTTSVDRRENEDGHCIVMLM